MENNKKTLIIVAMFGLVIAIIGGILAYWNWQSTEEQKTVVNFTIEGDFSCAADGGGNITSGSINLIPTEINDNTTANYIKREVKAMPTITKEGKTIYMDLWLDAKETSSDTMNQSFELSLNGSCVD